MLFGDAADKTPLICVVPTPLTTTPPFPGVPITVLGPMSECRTRRCAVISDRQVAAARKEQAARADVGQVNGLQSGDSRPDGNRSDAAESDAGIEVRVYDPVALVNDRDFAETLLEILTVPSALPVKLTAADTEFGIPLGNQFVAVFQLVLDAPVQVKDCARTDQGNRARAANAAENRARLMIASTTVHEPKPESKQNPPRRESPLKTRS